MHHLCSSAVLGKCLQLPSPNQAPRHSGNLRRCRLCLEPRWWPLSTVFCSPCDLPAFDTLPHARGSWLCYKLHGREFVFWICSYSPGITLERRRWSRCLCCLKVETTYCFVLFLRDKKAIYSRIFLHSLSSNRS